MVVSHLSKYIISQITEMSMLMKNYYIGFDIGTDSIGWATTDEEYNLLKARGQDFWGTYLFDPAKTASERRLNRTARRRLARKRQRIKLLQELFAEEIAKVDFWFYERLNNSKYDVDDKSDDVRYSDNLFRDIGFRDKDYSREYRTIYHLRQAFTDKEKAKEIKDVRLLYLAVAHIIKHRGHFLFEGQTIKAGDKAQIAESFKKINEILIETDEDNQTLSLENLPAALDLLCDKTATKTNKEKGLKQYFGIKNDKTCGAIIKAMVGGKVSIMNLFGTEDADPKDFCFDEANFELEKYQVNFSEEEFALFCELKAIYDWSVLAKILGDYRYVSQAMCAKYDRHHEDKRILKEYVLENFGKEKYKEVFYCKSGINNYAAYVGSDRGRKCATASKEDFYKYLKTIVNKDDKYIWDKIEDGTFLDKLRTSANAVIPYQVHKDELETILENASENFPFLNEVQDGYSVKQKIVMLMTFRVPYYVGPLNTQHADGGFAWVKKYEGTERMKITPWNFDDVVDKQASEDAFIERMTNKCTYLIGEDVLPKQSLLYSEFAFLNELNNVTYRGQRLDKQARDAIVEYAKENSGKITTSKIGKILEGAGLIEKGEGKKENFAGIDGEIKGSFATYRFFKRVFGENFDADMCEEIIKWFTIMGDAMRTVARAKRKYGFDDETAKKLRDLNCSGWGRMSREFLDGEEIIHVSKETGEVYTIIEAMRETGCNLMELLSSRYDFSDAVQKYNDNNTTDDAVTYRTVEDLYCSPSVKRAIWRTICLVREIEKVQGGPPKRIFIEMARDVDGKNEKTRTKSRKVQMLELYKSVQKDVRNWMSDVDDKIANIEKTEDARFLSDKLYLYYMQGGRSAYSGKPIDIEDVFNTNICDIDHIYPQSKIKDDSIINNRVLCFKSENQNKKDVYPVPCDIRDKMTPLWTMWRDKGFISEEKYKRLTRSSELTVDELSDFINRQLVETRQSTKAVAEILKKMYPDTDIVYSKAGNVNEFKNWANKPERDAKIVKVRELNDLHHAKDAYLNIVVGNCYYMKFNRNAAVFFKNNGRSSYNLKKLFEGDISGAWTPSMLNKVAAVVHKNTCKVVRFTSCEHGKLFDVKPVRAKDKLVPLKCNGILERTNKYGGYDSAKTSHFALVKSVDIKGKIQLSIEAIPIYIDLLHDEEALIGYLVKNSGLFNPQIVIEKIKKYSLIKFNGAYYWLSSKYDSTRIGLCNANQLVLDKESTIYLKKILSFNEKREKNKNIEPSFEFDKISKEQNIMLYDEFVAKLANAPYSNLVVIPKEIALLKEKRDEFESFSATEQITLLISLLNFMCCCDKKADLRLIGGKAGAGVQKRLKKIDENEEALLITQSPTGYYKETVDLTAFYRQ